MDLHTYIHTYIHTFIILVNSNKLDYECTGEKLGLIATSDYFVSGRQNGQRQQNGQTCDQFDDKTVGRGENGV